MIQALAFCGAFNPPSIAHIRLAEYAMKETGAEKVVFVPSKMSYIQEEQKKDRALSDRERLYLLNRISEMNPWILVSSYELMQPEQPRTYQTLKHLESEGIRASLLLGSDKLPEFEHGWCHIPEIAREFGIVCLTRNHDDAEKLIASDPFLSGISAGIRLLHAPAEWQEVSSSRIRNLLREIEDRQKELSLLLPDELKGYFLGF